MSDSLMSRDERAKFRKEEHRKIRLRRKRLRMAELYEKERNNEFFFVTSNERLLMFTASEAYKTSEIEWRHRELNAGAREY